MTAYWKRIIQNQYKAGNITESRVLEYVPSRITQIEADEILNAT
jgi:hypothetical protein